MGNELFAIDDQRMARIGATSVANNHIGPFAQQVDNFSFTFIAPLGSNDDCDGHDSLPLSISRSASNIECTVGGFALPPPALTQRDDAG